jgi:hypothetical protein
VTPEDTELAQRAYELADREHICPRPGCTTRIPRGRFACKPDWSALSKPVQRAIWATAFRPGRDRIQAVKAAMEEWGATR